MKLLLILSFTAFSMLLSANVCASELNSYDAIYDISLASVSRGSGVVNVSGSMNYAQVKKCDKWHFNSKINMLVITKGGEEKHINWNISGIEDDKGEKFSFSVSNVKEEGARVAFAGVADKVKKVANFTLPSKLAVELPDDVVFPISQLKNIIKAIDDKSTFISMNYFDGSSFSSLYKNSVIISKAKDIMGKNMYPVNMSFFTYGSKKELPDYEIFTDMDVNGVSHYIKQDFGDFSVNITEKSISYPVVVGCE